MAQYGAFSVFQRVTADALNATIPNVVVKQATQTVASSVTPIADTELTVALPANSTWLVEFDLRYGALAIAAGSPAGLRTTWSVPAGVTSTTRSVLGIASNVAPTTDNSADQVLMRTGVHAYTTAVLYGNRNTAGNLLRAYEMSIIVMGSTAGNVTLQWAQGVSNATGTTVNQFSFVRATQYA